jgi:hypothetical protein
MHASHAGLPNFNSSKLSPVVDSDKLIVFQIIESNQKFNIHSLFEVTSYYHDVFTFTLFLSEGRAGVAREPSNKVMLFLPAPENKVSLTSSLISSFHLLFIYPSYLSLSLSAAKS